MSICDLGIFTCGPLGGRVWMSAYVGLVDATFVP